MRKKLHRAIILLFIVTAIANGFYEYEEHEEILLESNLQKGIAIMDGFSSGFKEVYDLEDKESLLIRINNLKWNNPQLRGIQINVLKGELLPFYPDIDHILDENNFAVIETKGVVYEVKDDMLQVYSPIIISGNIVGTQVARFSLEEMNSRLKKEIIELMLLYLVFYSVVTFIMFIYLDKVIIKPIVALKAGIKNFSEGNFHYKIKLRTKDEFQEISEEFEIMSKRILELTTFYENHSNELEKEVSKRTKELEAKLEELENTRLAVMNILEDTDESNKDLTLTKEQLKEKVRLLDEVNKKKDEFISVTAHELKTPLTSIRGFTQLLKNEQVMKSKEMREKYFDIIINDTDRLGRLITDILDLTRFDLGTMKFNMEDISTDVILEDVKNLVGLQVKNKGLKFSITAQPGITITADRSRIVQVVSNLVNNSIKYTEKGEIRLEVFTKEKDKVHFRVADTGVGIPKEAQSRIFERFYQADSSYTRKVGGSGLGLSICKAIVEAHGGNIWFESRRGNTVFEFTLNTNSKI